jgi:hypothetical protein
VAGPLSRCFHSHTAAGGRTSEPITIYVLQGTVSRDGGCRQLVVDPLSRCFLSHTAVGGRTAEPRTLCVKKGQYHETVVAANQRKVLCHAIFLFPGPEG